MSIDYQLFFQTDGPVQTTLDTISNVDGVDISDGLHITGLVATSIEELGSLSREIVLNDFGEYGLVVNWAIRGTYDEETNTTVLAERLLRCAVTIMKARPDCGVSLMRNGESFYLFYDSKRIIVSPVFKESKLLLESLFDHSYEIEEIVY